MKKFLVTVIILIQMLTLTGYRYYSAYESSEPVQDFAGVLDGLNITNYLGQKDTVELSVYTYKGKEQYFNTFSELKERGIDYVALFINVDNDGNHLDSHVEIRSNDGLIPSDQALNSYYKSVKPLLESEDYEAAINGFFKNVCYDINDAQFVKEQDQEKRHEEYLNEQEAEADKATFYPLYLGLAASIIVGLIIAGVHIKRLKKQLKSVEYSKHASDYINGEYVSIRSQQVDNGILDIFL